MNMWGDESYKLRYVQVNAIGEGVFSDSCARSGDDAEFRLSEDAMASSEAELYRVSAAVLCGWNGDSGSVGERDNGRCPRERPLGVPIEYTCYR